MTTPLGATPGVRDLIRRLDAAVAARHPEVICQQVKDVLRETVGQGGDLLDAEFLRPTADHYARRLLYKDPQGRYSVVVMVWAPGQATHLHDHEGHWCVECVYRGALRITSFELLTPEDADIVRFREADVVRSRPGDAGALIPPFEYHTMENPTDETAVTVHVYAGELTSCNAFVPVDGGYRRERRTLSYTA